MNTSLEEKLKLHITMYPEEAPIYLNIIATAMQEYKKKVDEERSVTTMHALYEMLMLEKTKKMKKQTKVPFLINTAYTLFPKGDCDGHAGIAKDFYELFVKTVKEENTLVDHKDWLISTYGMERHEWLKNLMENNK